MKRERVGKTYTAWALVRQWRGSPPFIVGRYWKGAEISPQMEGHRVCLFKTRREAMSARDKPDHFYRDFVVRVRVRVVEVP